MRKDVRGYEAVNETPELQTSTARIDKSDERERERESRSDFRCRQLNDRATVFKLNVRRDSSNDPVALSEANFLSTNYDRF
jgi:hypothetical protein